MPTWEDAADWYLGMVDDPARGFNDLADDTALELLGPVPGRRILDVGSGEGRFARRLARAGAHVVATEPVAAFHQAAIDAETREPLGIRHHRAPAEDLHALNENENENEFDAVCAVLVLHHVEHLATALAQARRVLTEDGALVAVIPHPLTDHPGAGWTPDGRRIIGDYPHEGYWSSGAPGVASIRDIGWYHRTLSTWLTGLADGGFRVDRIREPVGGQGTWVTVPRFLAWRATKTVTRPVTRPTG